MSGLFSRLRSLVGSEDDESEESADGRPNPEPVAVEGVSIEERIDEREEDRDGRAGNRSEDPDLTPESTALEVGEEPEADAKPAADGDKARLTADDIDSDPQPLTIPEAESEPADDPDPVVVPDAEATAPASADRLPDDGAEESATGDEPANDVEWYIEGELSDPVAVESRESVVVESDTPEDDTDDESGFIYGVVDRSVDEDDASKGVEGSSDELDEGGVAERAVDADEEDQHLDPTKARTVRSMGDDDAVARLQALRNQSTDADER